MLEINLIWDRFRGRKFGGLIASTLIGVAAGFTAHLLLPEGDAESPLPNVHSLIAYCATAIFGGSFGLLCGSLCYISDFLGALKSRCESRAGFAWRVLPYAMLVFAAILGLLIVMLAFLVVVAWGLVLGILKL